MQARGCRSQHSAVEFVAVLLLPQERSSTMSQVKKQRVEGEPELMDAEEEIAGDELDYNVSRGTGNF